MRADYDFPRLTRADFPRLAGWLACDHVAEWWGDPATELALIDQEIDEGLVDMRLVELQGQAFAFIQDYDIADFPAPHLADQPPRTRAIDTFIGDTAYLGKGHAPGYLRQRARRLLAARAAQVVVDPDPKNTRAIAAYRKAGFRGETQRGCGDGQQAQVMTFTPSSLHKYSGVRGSAPAPAPKA